MRVGFVTVIVCIAIVLVPVGRAGAKMPNFEQMAKAEVACNKGLASNKNVSAKLIAACNIANVPSPTACKTGPAVNEAYVYPGDEALLRVGHRPEIFVAATTENPNPVSAFVVSDITKLCGDPIDPTLTPPATPLAQAQVKKLFKACQKANQCPMKVELSPFG